MRVIGTLLFTTLVSISAVAMACNDHDHAAGKGKRVVGTESPWVAGDVLAVDREDGTITLGHAHIATLKMPGMQSMIFKTASPKLVEVARPGDKVRFRVRLVDDEPTVTRIKVAKP